jgi:hypothetical protein
MMIKRYNLGIPEELYEEIHIIADKEGTSILEILKKFMKIGCIINKIQQESDSCIIIRQKGEDDKEIVFI